MWLLEDHGRLIKWHPLVNFRFANLPFEKRILQKSKEQQFVDGKTEENINYFGSKLYGHNFIDNVMSGVYSSGDYELFLMLLDFLHNETKIQCEEYDMLKNNL